MATEAGFAPGAVETGSLAERAAAFLDLQVETLMAEGPQTTALAAGRVAHAMKALWAARSVWSQAEPDPKPAADKGDDDDDDFEPPAGDAEDRELDEIILRGLGRIRGRAEAAALAAEAQGQAGPVEAGGDRPERRPDTS